MKNLKLIGFLIILSSSLMFMSCETEYDVLQGPAGADGATGAAGDDGAAGADGVDGSAASCISCHSNTHREPIYAAYELSFHSKGLTEGAVNYAGARADCAQCHSHEGYVDFITKGTTNPTGYYGLSETEILLDDNGTPDDPSDDFPVLGEFGEILYTNNPVAVVSPISCDTCHGTHMSFDFENDGMDFALRALEPVSLITDGTMIDYGGGSNACIGCHQPRRTGPTDPNGTGNFFISSSHWGPHHGPQATMLEGIQGIEIAGSVPYPDVASSTHRQGASCVSCHMGTTDNGSNGLHTWISSDNSCTACHTTVPAEVTGLAADMAHLGELLETAGALHFDNGWHPVKGTVSIEVAEAAWNFLFVHEDMSEGVHNPIYAKALISNSIEALE